ncbi:unnamed protein product [Medioppia subpectinata]|uniref:Uncharacterized protein n=1 Tax=Medioppia subpectinata TaxID=1979941 RepID=A0A7R9PU26_9ACAR|nr:unnamed protein product [Medioppia subpectinata]CAG2101302.1 unnamed protein product [Medioppia subpectinata]
MPSLSLPSFQCILLIVYSAGNTSADQTPGKESGIGFNRNVLIIAVIVTLIVVVLVVIICVIKKCHKQRDIDTKKVNNTHKTQSPPRPPNSAPGVLPPPSVTDPSKSATKPRTLSMVSLVSGAFEYRGIGDLTKPILINPTDSPTESVRDRPTELTIRKKSPTATNP